MCVDPVRTPGVIGLSAFLWVSASFCVFASEFSIELHVRAQGQEQTASSNQAASVRPVLSAKAGDPLWVKWIVANVQKSGAIPDVTVHVFLNRETRTDRPETSKPASPAVFENALIMDFNPGAKSSGELLLQTPAPGDYLLRVETIGTGRKAGQERFAAVGLKVQ
jgi:hypothetical protein